MICPPSLSPEVRDRAFTSANGELGLLSSDVPAFLDACEQDDIVVLGWEAWIIDHGFDGTGLVPFRGAWTGFVPVSGELVVRGGASPRTEIPRSLSCDSDWSTHLRFNITI